MGYLTYIITPLVGAVIGYFTNWLAIKMLFRPHTEKRLFGVKLPFTPGLIPKERDRLTHKVAETVSQHVLTPEVLTKELSSADLWEGLRENDGLLSITVDRLLSGVGVDDLGVYAEERILVFLRDERVKQTVVSVVMEGLRGLWVNRDENWNIVRDFCVEKGDAFLQSPDYPVLIDKLLTAIRKKIFAEGVTLEGLLPGAWPETVTDAVGDLLPKAVEYIKQWLEEKPELDEKLGAMVRGIIDENFGRFIGLFVDHKKIYANIKEGIFRYLSDPENQVFMTEKLHEAVNTFTRTECARWESSLPDDAYWAERLHSFTQDQSIAATVDLVFSYVRDRMPSDEKLTETWTSLEERLTALLHDRLTAAFEKELPGPVKDTVSNVCTKIGAVTLAQIMDSLDSPEKKAALGRAFERIAAYIAEHMKIKEMIEQKVNAFAIDEAESLILSVVNRELNMITVLGGVLGFLIGLLSLMPQLLV